MKSPQTKRALVEFALHVAFVLLWLGLCNFLTLFNMGISASGSPAASGLQTWPISDHGHVVYITELQAIQQALYIMGLMVGCGTWFAIALYVRLRYNIKVLWR